MQSTPIEKITYYTVMIQEQERHYKELNLVIKAIAKIMGAKVHD